jgi:hypothetical protein
MPSVSFAFRVEQARTKNPMIAETNDPTRTAAFAIAKASGSSKAGVDTRIMSSPEVCSNLKSFFTLGVREITFVVADDRTASA